MASGHVRELLFSHAVRAGVVEEVVAFDQDARSLAEAEATTGSTALKTMQGSIARLIVGRYDLSDFDLVYTAGLFDYVDERAGKRLVKTMFDMLKPGGMLLVGNFLNDIEDIGYMESFMGWNLVFRTREQIASLADGIVRDWRDALFRGFRAQYRLSAGDQGGVGALLVAASCAGERAGQPRPATPFTTFSFRATR